MGTHSAAEGGPPRCAARPAEGADLRAAIRDSGPVGLGAFPMGVALGVLIVQSGFDWWWALPVSGLIYAGSLEFLLVGMLTTTAPLAQIALAAFLVNFRHVFYALSFPLHRVHGRWAKAYSTFALSDEAYAVTAGGAAREWSRRRILLVQVFIHAYWAGGAVLGALLGTLVPTTVTGLEFAVTALFTVLAIDAFRARRDVPALLLALGCALAARAVFPDQMLLAAFILFAACLLARYVLIRGRPAHA